MNIYLTNPKAEICCGCGACVAKCPTHCIIMKENEEGFSYPIVDIKKCMGCNLCSRVCPFERQKKNLRENVSAYAAHSNNDSILVSSSSGGVFSEIASCFLHDGGYVCGATIDQYHNVHHIVIDSLDELFLLQGSKYVQSDMTNVWGEIGNLLRGGKKVLFTGTPCQVAAAKNIFHSEQLYTIDVLCHGVPSQKLFDQYISYLEEKHHGVLTGIWFRDKEKNGWSITQKYTIEKNRKKKDFYLDRHLSEYFSGFLRNMTQRESCYQCPFTTVERCGDITLADFWGIEKVHPEYYCDKGTSLVFANNPQGYELLNLCSGNIVLNSVTVDDALVQNPNFLNPPKREPQRDIIYQDVANDGFKKTGKKYILPSNAYKYRLAALLGISVAKHLRRKTK